MADSQPNGDAAFPGRTVTLNLSAAQVAYVRVLLFEDLQRWAEALAEHAHAAAEQGACHSISGEDARDTFRGNVTSGMLDVFGWGVRGDVEALRWLEKQARERLGEVA